LVNGPTNQFYHPEPKPPKPAAQPEPEQPSITAADILREILGNDSEHLSDVLVLMRDDKGVCGFVGNLDGAGETLLFMEQIKHEMLTRMRGDDENPPLEIS